MTTNELCTCRDYHSRACPPTQELPRQVINFHLPKLFFHPFVVLGRKQKGIMIADFTTLISVHILANRWGKVQAHPSQQTFMASFLQPFFCNSEMLSSDMCTPLNRIRISVFCQQIFMASFLLPFLPNSGMLCPPSMHTTKPYLEYLSFFFFANKHLWPHFCYPFL